MKKTPNLAEDPNLGEADYSDRDDVDDDPESRRRDFDEKRYTYVIDPDLQFRFLFTWFGMLLLYIALVIASFYFTMEYFVGQITDYNLQKVLAQIFRYNSVFVIFLTVLFGMFSILISHKIAGPAYNICRSINRMMKGNFDFTVQLRQSDYLKQIADHLNDLLSYLRNRKESVSAVYEDLQELKSSIRERQDDSDELLSICQSMESRLQDLKEE